MLLNCGLPRDEIRARREHSEHMRLSQWHPFFAFWPRRIGQTQCVWLEWIRRKGEYFDVGYHGGEWQFEYRLSTDRECDK